MISLTESEIDENGCMDNPREGRPRIDSVLCVAAGVGCFGAIRPLDESLVGVAAGATAEDVSAADGK